MYGTLIVPQLRFGLLLEYFCSQCGNILKEKTTLQVQNHQIKEECPSCGALLIDTLQNRRVEPEGRGVNAQSASNNLSIEFQTAYQRLSTKLGFDIKRIDSLLNLDTHGSICIIGDQRYTQLLIDRLCVHTLLPRKYGGIGQDYSKIIVIDAGNCTDVYQYVDFCRQYGLEIDKVLRNVVVSRVFTIYQLAYLITHDLPKIVEKFSTGNKVIVIVVYGLLHLFSSDPHINRIDAKNLIKEISSSLRKLTKDWFVIVSFTHSNRQYMKPLITVFDKCIKITNTIDNSIIMRIDINSPNRVLKRKDINYDRSIRLSDREILLVPTR
jgi:Rad51